VDQVTPKRDIRMVVPIGRPFPLHAGASSKALLAHLTDDEQQAYLSEQATLPAVTEHTITDPQRLRAELALIKERGYATSNGERQSGAASVAAPLLGRRGEPFAVISLCGPMERFGPHLDDASVRLLSAVRLAEKHARF
jgi:DNA-binding IclR family transcriptional regulator